MRLVFASNYFNHHQSELSKVLYNTVDAYHFIATSEMRPERRNMGYQMEYIPEYVLNAHKSEEEKNKCERLLSEADVVIGGAAPESMLRKRIISGKLFFRYTERPLRNGPEPMKYLPRLIRWHAKNPQNKPVYLLCASAYTAGDYAMFGLYTNRAFRWGYFTEVRKYEDLDCFFEKKKKNRILWAGRLLHWKHPEDGVEVAKRLKKNGYDFQLDIIGTGEMEDRLKAMIAEADLADCVRLLGVMKPGEVRDHMEKSGIYLFTSDKREGWGAVLNEAMNSGCAVVASHAIGSVPYLINNEENGLIYKSGDIDSLYEKVRALLDSPEKQETMGRHAYETIVNEWNAEVAAHRLLVLSERILSGEKYPDLYERGPCSKAPLLRDDWM